MKFEVTQDGKSAYVYKDDGGMLHIAVYDRQEGLLFTKSIGSETTVDRLAEIVDNILKEID